jgi:tetratricopeptide (TPR) repeat protein
LANEEKATLLRHRAEGELNKTHNAMTRLLTELDKDELAQVPSVGKVRQILAKFILRHYRTYLQDQSTEPELRVQTARTYLSIGGLYGIVGERGKAVEAYRKAVALTEVLTQEFPSESSYWNQLAHSRAALGGGLSAQGQDSLAAEEHRKAIAAFDQAQRLAPDNPFILNNMAFTLLAAPSMTVRDWSRALGLTQRAVELKPDLWGFWRTLGMACYKTGDSKNAVAAVEKSMHLLGGGDSYDWFLLAMAHSQLGDSKQARMWFDKAVDWMDKNQPTNVVLKSFRTETAELLGINNKK